MIGKIKRYFGNDPLIPGTMDNYKLIEHGAARPAELAYVANGKHVKCLRTGRVYPSVTAAAIAAGVTQPTMSARCKAGNGWVRVDG